MNTNEYTLSEIPKIAYEMEKAYKEYSNGFDAVNAVSKKHDIDKLIAWAMWHAIDAYVDLNE